LYITGITGGNKLKDWKKKTVNSTPKRAVTDSPQEKKGMHFARPIHIWFDQRRF
jgi:hypothetical protein